MQWIIDPIDGTANFVRGVLGPGQPWTLMVDGVVRVGVVSAFLLDGVGGPPKGRALTGRSPLKGTQMRVSKVRRVPDAFSPIPRSAAGSPAGAGQGFVDLLRDAGRSRGFGDFWSCMMVAEGAADMACIRP